MKRKPSTAKSNDRPKRSQSDNFCKQLAEQYPAEFAQWLFGAGGQVKVEKTELSREPIRADSVIFARGESERLHTEFQTTLKSDVPVPLRMLDYYVGLKRQNPHQRVRQVLVVLKATGEVIPDRYEDEWTVHRYLIVKLWEQDPAELLKHAGLLPLATLCRTESGEQLLGEVAAQIKRIKSREQRRETLNWSRVLAGLRYDTGLVYQILKESDMLEQSVVYQDIFQKGAQSGLQKGERRGLQKGERRGLQKGERRGLQKGLQQEGRMIALRLLERRYSKLTLKVRQQIEQLTLEQLESLCEALLDFQTKDDLTRWLKQQVPAR